MLGQTCRVQLRPGQIGYHCTLRLQQATPRWQLNCCWQLVPLWQLRTHGAAPHCMMLLLGGGQQQCGCCLERVPQQHLWMRAAGHPCTTLLVGSGALSSGRQEVVKVLLKSGTDACATDTEGHTPLLLAAQQGRGSIVQALLTASTHQSIHLAAALEAAEGAEDADTAEMLAEALAAQQEAEKAAEGCPGAGCSSQALPTQPPQHEHAPEESVTQQQPQQQQEEDVPGHRCSVAAVLRSIKEEPGTVYNAAAAAAAVGQQPGPQALQLLQEAVAAGLMLPNEQQMDYFCLADQPFDGPAAAAVHSTPGTTPHHQKHGQDQPQWGSQGGSVTLPLGHSRVQHVYPSLAPGFEQLTQQLSEAEQQLLLQQQQQLPGAKKRKLSSTAAATVVLASPSDAARRLLLALRCLLCWEGRRLQEQGLPLLLQLLLFGGPAPDADGVVECVDLVSDEEEKSLYRQLMQGDAELLIAREVQPREQQQAGSGAAAVGGGGSSSGGVRVKWEPGVAN